MDVIVVQGTAFLSVVNAFIVMLEFSFIFSSFFLKKKKVFFILEKFQHVKVEKQGYS